MFPVAVLNPQENEWILDLCAAPGGKTTQICDRMHHTGLVAANEPVKKRAQILARNLERMGADHALAVNADPRQLAGIWQGLFDGVLVDAPCSGEGMFRRDPAAMEEWSEEKSLGCAQRQLQILDAAAEMVKPGGRLVYSTCTFHDAENEGNVEAFLRAHPDFHLQSFDVCGYGNSGMATLYPHKVHGEGQFAALLVRDPDADTEQGTLVQLPKCDRKTLSCMEVAGFYAGGQVCLFGNRLVLVPQLDGLPQLKGIGVHRVFMHLGEVKGSVFHPDHAWALSVNPPKIPGLDMHSDEVQRYLSGETLNAPEHLKGYVLARFGELNMGFGKVSVGMMKNHYPKGLRRRTDLAPLEPEDEDF